MPMTCDAAQSEKVWLQALKLQLSSCYQAVQHVRVGQDVSRNWTC
jgi:hypothetical protein